MKLWQIIYSIVYGLMVVAYIFTSTGKNFKLRATNKIAMSASFLTLAFVCFFLNDDLMFNSWRYLALLAIFLCFLGDVLLLNSFSKGGLAFSLGNLTFFAYLICYVANAKVSFLHLVWFVVPVVVLVLIDRKFILYKIKKPSLKLKCAGYLTTVILHGFFSLAVVLVYPTIETILLAIGLVLFMISDHFLLSGKFVFFGKKLPQVGVTLTYYPALWLVALSLFFG